MSDPVHPSLQRYCEGSDLPLDEVLELTPDEFRRISRTILKNGPFQHAEVTSAWRKARQHRNNKNTTRNVTQEQEQQEQEDEEALNSHTTVGKGAAMATGESTVNEETTPLSSSNNEKDKAAATLPYPVPPRARATDRTTSLWLQTVSNPRTRVFRLRKTTDSAEVPDQLFIDRGVVMVQRFGFLGLDSGGYNRNDLIIDMNRKKMRVPKPRCRAYAEQLTFLDMCPGDVVCLIVLVAPHGTYHKYAFFGTIQSNRVDMIKNGRVASRDIKWHRYCKVRNLPNQTVNNAKWISETAAERIVNITKHKALDIMASPEFLDVTSPVKEEEDVGIHTQARASPKPPKTEINTYEDEQFLEAAIQKIEQRDRYDSTHPTQNWKLKPKDKHV